MALMCSAGKVTRLISAIVLAVAMFPVSGGAQGTGSIHGAVQDSSGAAIIGAEVSAPGVPYSSTTDEAGAFRLNGLSTGSFTLTARRLGFIPASIAVALSSTGRVVGGVKIQLVRVSSVLPTVRVSGRRMNYTGRLAGYYERLEKKSAGYFITRDQIDKEGSRSLSQLLQHAPGISGSRGRSGLQSIRMRGRNCWPLVWIDGTPMPAGEVDLDSFSPNSLHGIELYLGSTTAPARFTLARNLNSCGTVVLWSRGPDTDPLTSPQEAARDLKRMLATVAVYTAEQVDRQAALSDPSLVVTYPPALYAEGLSGSVIAEFVVSAEGKIEEGTLGIVTSTNAQFSEAVRRALETAAFSPAQLNGVAVKQLVQQPFSFDARASRPGG